MTKKLAEMTLEELWELFPIVLTKHQAIWKSFFKDELLLLKRAFADGDVIINHIGSTAVEGLWAKPIIDILVEVPSNKSLAAYYALIRGCGYRLMSEAPSRASFNKGYTEKGFAERVFHLHLRFYGDHDELYFRDYLRLYPQAAKEYEALKFKLWKQFEHNRDAYTEAKTAFIAQATAKAKSEFGKRYQR